MKVVKYSYKVRRGYVIKNALVEMAWVDPLPRPVWFLQLR